jgi:hypothetical protein
MDLQQKFKATTSSRTVPVNTLTIGVAYDIIYAETVTTKFGPTVVLTLLSNVPATTKVFLPKRYSSLFTEDEIFRRGRCNSTSYTWGHVPYQKHFYWRLRKTTNRLLVHLKLLENKKLHLKPPFLFLNYNWSTMASSSSSSATDVARVILDTMVYEFQV